MKIIIGQFAHETNTFSNVPTTREVFEAWILGYGDEVMEIHDGVQDYVGGMIAECKKRNIEIVPTLTAFAYPSGIITTETYEELRDDLIQSIKSAGEVDAICLAMHGAGVTEKTEDLEGTFLKELREEIGYEIPIVVTLDLHANMTELMVSEADALLGVNYYPHTDSYDRGVEAVELAVDIVSGKVDPVMSLKSLPLLIPTSTTNISPAKDVNELCWEYESEADVIDCTFFHGFPYTDIKKLGVSVLAITNQSEEKAEQITTNVSEHIWDIRDQFTPEILTPKQGISRAIEIEGGPIVINETSDNPGGGTPGDGTHLLKAMLDANVEKSSFGYIYDPAVAQLAHEVGVGSFIEVELGGKTDDLHGKPLQVKGYIKSLSDGTFNQSSPMWQGLEVDLGKSARLQVGNVDVIICSEKSQTLDEQVFLLHGIDVSTYKIIALKSSQHFRAGFEPIAEQIITVDSPGLTALDFTIFEFKNVERPIYPLDEMDSQ